MVKTSTKTVKKPLTRATGHAIQGSRGARVLQDITNRSTSQPQALHPQIKKRKYGGVSSKAVANGTDENADGDNILTVVESPREKPASPATASTSSTRQLLLVSQNHTKSVRKAQLAQRQLSPCVALLMLPDASGLHPAGAVDRVKAATLLAEAYTDFDYLSLKPRFAAHFAMGMESDFRRLEQSMRVDGSYLLAPNPAAAATATVTAQDRQQMVAAMLRFAAGGNWSLAGLHLAVSLLDRFLAAALTGEEVLASGTSHPSLADPAYRLVVAASVLWMAHKLEETQLRFDFGALQRLFFRTSEGQRCVLPAPQRPAIVHCERRIVKALDYDLMAPTAYKYLSMITPLLHFDLNAFSLAKCLGEVCLLEASLLQFAPSELACATAYLVRRLHLQESRPAQLQAGTVRPWPMALHAFTNRSEAQLLPCAAAIQRVLQRELFAATRVYANGLLSGSDCSFESLLRTLSHLAGNNSRSMLSLQPFSFSHPSGRISADLQAYHDLLPLLLLQFERAVLKQVGLTPLPTPADTPQGSGDPVSGEDCLCSHSSAGQVTVAGSSQLSGRTTQPLQLTQSQSQTQEQSRKRAGGFEMHIFETFGKDCAATSAPVEQPAPESPATTTQDEEVFAAATALSQLSAVKGLRREGDSSNGSLFEVCRLASQDASIPVAANTLTAVDRYTAGSLSFLQGGLLLGNDELTALTAAGSCAEFPPLAAVAPAVPPRKGLKRHRAEDQNTTAAAASRSNAPTAAGAPSALSGATGCASTDDFASLPFAPFQDAAARYQPACTWLPGSGSREAGDSLSFHPPCLLPDTAAAERGQSQCIGGIVPRLDPSSLPSRRRLPSPQGTSLSSATKYTQEAESSAVLPVDGSGYSTPRADPSARRPTAAITAQQQRQGAAADTAPAALTFHLLPHLQEEFQLHLASVAQRGGTAEALLTLALKEVGHLPSQPASEVVRHRYRAFFHKLMPCHPY